MPTAKQLKLTNGQAAELFNTLNAIKFPKDSHIEYAGTKTLRKMKAWQQAYAEKIKDIDDDNAATYKNDDGVEVLLKQTLNRTVKDKKTGEDVSEEHQVSVYTKEGEKKRTEAKRKLGEQPSLEDFEIHTTADGVVLTAYQKQVLEELGFYKTATDEAAPAKKSVEQSQEEPAKTE